MFLLDHILSGQAILDALRPPPWLIRGYLRCGTVAALEGPNRHVEAVAAELAAAVRSGEPWRGAETRKGSVICLGDDTHLDPTAADLLDAIAAMGPKLVIARISSRRQASPFYQFGSTLGERCGAALLVLTEQHIPSLAGSAATWMDITTRRRGVWLDTKLEDDPEPPAVRIG